MIPLCCTCEVVSASLKNKQKHFLRDIYSHLFHQRGYSLCTFLCKLKIFSQFCVKNK